MTFHQVSPGENEHVTQCIDLEPDLANWLNDESKMLGISPSILVATLLEWARSEGITRDADMQIFSVTPDTAT